MRWLQLRCGGCQVQVIGDVTDLLSRDGGAWLAQFPLRAWVLLPGVLPSYARNILTAAVHAEPDKWLLYRPYGEGLDLPVVLPVMGRPWVLTLPDVVVAGTPKGGTTTLFDFLTKQPSVSPSNAKALNFFDRKAEAGVGWYASCFIARWSIRGGRHTRRLADGSTANGGSRACPTGGVHADSDDGRACVSLLRGAHVLEATSNYIYHPAVPSRLAATIPTARLVFALRDPSARAINDYNMWKRHGITPRSLEVMVGECINVLHADPVLKASAVAKGMVYTHVLRQNCVGRGGSPAVEPPPDGGYGDLCSCYENIVAKGLYHEQLTRWARVVPRAQMLVLRTEALGGLCAAHLLLTFLGLPEHSATAWDSAIVLPSGNAQAVAGVAVKAQLDTFFGSAPEWEHWLDVC